ncbi:hypothetical protein D3C87_2065880 [compost metagenome]
MAIEPAMGEPCRVHDFGNGDRIKPLVAKEFAGCIQNPKTVLGHLLACDSHTYLGSRQRRRTVAPSTYMMNIINIGS